MKPVPNGAKSMFLGERAREGENLSEWCANTQERTAVFKPELEGGSVVSHGSVVVIVILYIRIIDPRVIVPLVRHFESVGRVHFDHRVSCVVQRHSDGFVYDVVLRNELK